ncbi:MAG: endonuclease domain-containing protein [Chloroflexi bacterium]|nr:endonuclease domain-containing protein [Chloroflexota bacterium]
MKGEGQDGGESTQSKDITARARHLRKNPTDSERALWNILRNRQIFGLRFRRQVPLGPFIVDFACLEARLIIEVDGGQHFENKHYDECRTAWLNSVGFRVLRFWNNQVLNEIDSVWQEIQVAVGELSPTHSCPPPKVPSPSKGEG